MRLTRVVLLCLALIMSFGFYRLVVYLLDDVDAQTFQATEEVMVDTAHILAGLLEANPDHSEQHIRATFTHAMEHQIDARIHNHAKSSIGINAYVCNAQGEVIFDSTKQRTGKDFSQHNDVLLTLRGEYGARSSRENENDPNSSILYVAAPVKRNGKIIGTVTVYKAQSDVSHFISERRRDILTATLLIGGGIVLFTIAVFIWLFRPVGQLTEYAHAISRGERRPLPNLGKGREVNTLGNALHDMRETLEGRRYVENYISALTHELKSPLAAIRGAAELLDETMPPEQQAKFLHNIRTETSRSETLVNNLLLLSELEGKPHLENLR
ncbi:MAG: histidine kinase dimerization/phospho-acceptor domain-containing protein, partial [Akkermansiaceae bacterium]